MLSTGRLIASSLGDVDQRGGVVWWTEAELAAIPIIEQHHVRFSAFEPTALQHDDSVSTDLPFIFMRCLSCACSNIALTYCAKTECSKGVREGPITVVNLLPFRARDEIRLLSKGGRSSR